MKIVNKTNNKYDISLLTVDCGNSYITYYMLLSFFRLNVKLPIYVIINKDNEYLYLLYNLAKEHSNLAIIDNTDKKLIPVNKSQKNIESVEHSLCLQYGIDNLVDSTNILICDNDIIFYNKRILQLFKEIKVYDIITEYPEISKYDLVNTISLIDFYKKHKTWDKEIFNTLYNYYKEHEPIISLKKLEYNKYYFLNYTFYRRFLPYCIFLKKSDLKIIDKNNIPNYISIDNTICKDTFAKFTYDALKSNLLIKYININNFIIHIGSSSFNIKSKDAYKADVITKLNSVNTSDLAEFFKTVN